MTDQTEDHKEHVALLSRAHAEWMQKHCPGTFAPPAVIEAHLRAAASCCLGAGLDLDAAADLFEDFAAGLRLKPGESAPTRGTMH